MRQKNSWDIARIGPDFFERWEGRGKLKRLMDLFSMMMILSFMLAGSHPVAATDSTAGNTAVGSNKYPPGVFYMRQAGVVSPTHYYNLGVIDPAHGYAYFTNDSSGVIIDKVRLSDFTVELGSEILYHSVPLCMAIDPKAGFLYLGVESGDLVKVRLSDMKQAGVLSLYDTLNKIGGIPHSVAIDQEHGFAYIGASQGSLIKMRLSDFTQVAVLRVSGHRRQPHKRGDRSGRGLCLFRRGRKRLDLKQGIQDTPVGFYHRRFSDSL